jgi:hypothetical protein
LGLRGLFWGELYFNSSYENTAKWETCQIFKENKQIVGARLAAASVTKTAISLAVSRAAVPRAVTTYTDHGTTSSAERNGG